MLNKLLNNSLDIFISLVMATRIAEILQFNKCLNQ